jgi:hypothetical protein
VANQGIYREAGPAGGLPFPRSNIVALTVVVVLLALLATMLPMALLVVIGRSGAGAWRMFKDGGPWMWLVLLAELGLPLLAALLGAFVMRGRRAPESLLFLGATMPFCAALLGAFWGQSRTIAAISGESVDPEMKARILAEGISESMTTDVFGGLVACGVALVAVAGAASAVASIDVAAASRGGQKPSSLGAIGAGAAGAAWIVATLVLGVIRMRDARIFGLLPVMPLLVIVPFAALAGRGAGALRVWHDASEAKRTAGAIVVAGASALLAMVAFERAIDASFMSTALGAISGESVDPSQQARILVEGIESARLGTAAVAMHTVFCIATFGLAVVPALGNGKHPASAGAIVATAVGIAIVGATLALGHSRVDAPRKVLSQADPELAGIALPVVVDTFSHRGTGPGYDSKHVLIKKDGSGNGRATLSERCEGSTRGITIFADRAATLAMVRERIGPPLPQQCTRSLVFVASREHPPEVDAMLGDYAAFLGRTSYVDASMDVADSDRHSYDKAIHVVEVSDDTLQVDGVEVKLPISPRDDASFGARAARVEYVFRPTDTVERVLNTMFAFERAYGSRLEWQIAREIDDGVRPPQPAIAIGGVVGFGGLGTKDVVVDGRLPPEIIKRIMRQNMGRFRTCYENALVEHPKLAGTVRVKFVIGRDGAVSTVQDAGSDINDLNLIKCINRAVLHISFPQPEGGIVTVVYPIAFTQPTF